MVSNLSTAVWAVWARSFAALAAAALLAAADRVGEPANPASGEAARPAPSSQEVIAAISRSLGLSEEHFNQVLGAKVASGVLEVDDIASKVYEVAIKDEDLDFKGFRWLDGGGFALPVTVALWSKERKADRSFRRKGESQSFTMMFKPSARGGFFVAGSARKGRKRKLLDSRIAEAAFAALPPTYHERFAKAE